MTIRAKAIAAASGAGAVRRTIALVHSFRWRRKVKRSGLFDAQWYLETYPDIANAKLDPVTHYLRHGFLEGRSPSPRFDSPWYLSTNADVARAGMNPLIHYIRQGVKEGRAIRRLGAGNTDTTTGTQQGNLSLRTHMGQALPEHVAVVVHAYYTDVFDELCHLFRNLPTRFSLFVAVASARDVRKVRRSISNHHVHADVVVRICQNRGRNFGSFLSEFARDVAKCDVVLHVHTKKSLYSGSEQTTWRNHLYGSLLGTRELVNFILGSFATYPDLGVIYPSTASVLPYWAHHWLSNGHLAPGLMNRLGVSEYQTQGYIDYPVGGMFWARVNAIRPLLEAGFTYQDFPEEAGQADGTLAHAIERSIVSLGKARGFGFGEIDLASDTLHLNWSPKNLHQYAAHTAEALRERIGQADLISFDIFDTLLLRPSSSPDSVMRFVGHILHQECGYSDDFFHVRKQAEAAARAAKHHVGDVNLQEIYAQFPAVSSWQEPAIRAAHDLELNMDMDIIRPRDAGIAAAQYARSLGKRVIAITDTYYPRSFIERLLQVAGINEAFDALYISSELGARKDRGDLWRLVLDTEHVAPSRWLHVGDNEHSDIQRASDLGIGVFHVMNPTTLFGLRCFDVVSNKKDYATSWGSDLVLGPLVNRVGANPFLPDRTFRPLTLDSAYDVGYVVFGPLMFAFTAWIAAHPATATLRHIYFLSREGYAMQRFYETIRRNCSKLSLPHSTYFYASRRMVISAVQGMRFAPEEVLANHNMFQGTLGDLLRSRLGLTVPKLTGVDDIEIELPRDTDQVIAYLGKLRYFITEHGRADLDLYRQYFDITGISRNEPAAVVDIGYSGTIQRNLQECLLQGLVGFYMATFKEITEVKWLGGSAFGCFCDAQNLWSPDMPVVKHSLLMEAFLSAPHGQLAGFELDSNGLQPRFKPDSHSDARKFTLAEMHDGANAYCEDLLRAYRDEHSSSLISVPIDLRNVQEPLRLLAEQEIKVPRAVAAALAVEDDFTGKKYHLVGQNLAVVDE